MIPCLVLACLPVCSLPIITISPNYFSLRHRPSCSGAWSLIKRSVQYKPIRKVFTTDGPAKGKEVRQTAAEITAYFKALNFAPEPTNDTVTFRGTMGKSQSQALYLTFCGFMSLAALAIVLTIMFPLVNEKDFSPWYYMCLASPGAGAYYWANAGKDVTVQVKMMCPLHNQIVAHSW